MNVALYVRVSTLDQNPHTQRRELEAYARRQGWHIARVYEEHASGADPRRSQLARLMEEIHGGKIEAVLVWKLDRFGRSLLDCLAKLNQLSIERVRFIATSQGIDTGDGYGNPTATFFLHVLAAAAEFERGILRERVRSGVARHREDQAAGRVGKSVHTRSGKDLPAGRPRRLIDLKAVRELQERGASVRQIAKTLRIPQATLRLRLKEVEAQQEQTHGTDTTTSV